MTTLLFFSERLTSSKYLPITCSIYYLYFQARGESPKKSSPVVPVNKEEDEKESEESGEETNDEDIDEEEVEEEQVPSRELSVEKVGHTFSSLPRNPMFSNF